MPSMTPIRRRSARLASAPTPKPAKTTSHLTSLDESDENTTSGVTTTAETMPVPAPTKTPRKTKANMTVEQLMKELPPTPTHDPASTHNANTKIPSTPAGPWAIKPTHAEMHPSKAQHTTQAPGSGLRLGFADIGVASLAARTPSKIPPTPSVPFTAKPTGPHRSPFTFRFSARPEELQQSFESTSPSKDKEEEDGEDGLAASVAANSLRQLRGNLVETREQPEAHNPKELEDVPDPESGRKMAKPKGKRGRFSAAHMAEFAKMDSIANHPSVLRALKKSASKARVDETTCTQGAQNALKRTRSKAGLQLQEREPAPTPAVRSLKRTQSKANLTEQELSSPTPPTSQTMRRTQSKPNPHGEDPDVSAATSSHTLQRSTLGENEPASGIPTASASAPHNLKRTLSKASPDDNKEATMPSTKKPVAPSSRIPAPSAAFGDHTPTSNVKRLKQRFEDDATTGRPESREGSAPNPTSETATRLGSSCDDASAPARSRSITSGIARPTVTSSSLFAAKGASIVSVTPGPHLRKVANAFSITAPKTESRVDKKLFDPEIFAKVKATMKARVAEADKATSQSSIPKPSGAQTTPVNRLQKMLPSVPATTPSGRLMKRVQFTPRTVQAVVAQNSPTPIKIGTPKAKAPADGSSKRDGTPVPAKTGSVTYPDLSKALGGYVSPSKAEEGKQTQAVPPSVPGTFTFRSDHTIHFDSESSTGFGTTKGQASIRHVRDSVLPTTNMPGSFPELLSNKENTIAPSPSATKFKGPAGGIVHGIENKKRARPSWAEEDAQVEEEEARRAAKKHKSGMHPVGAELFTAPRAKPVAGVTSSPIRQAPHTPVQNQSAKKKPFLSISRLNMLAQPKYRR